MRSKHWRVWTRTGLAFALAFMLMGGIGLQTASAQGATAARAQADPSCYRMRVELNGTQPAVKNCLLKTKPAPGSVTPNINTTNCNSSDLQLFEDAYYGSTEICFYGAGYTNLSDYWIVWPVSNWNDRVSSYKTGIWFGHFSWNSGDGTPRYDLLDHVLCNWIGSYWNDQASGLRISGSGSRTQTFC